MIAAICKVREFRSPPTIFLKDRSLVSAVSYHRPIVASVR
jgi:hypothetical protein